MLIIRASQSFILALAVLFQGVQARFIHQKRAGAKAWLQETQNEAHAFDGSMSFQVVEMFNT